MSDKINPQHYRNQPIECIEITQRLNFCMGNAVKYLWRYREKNGVEDLHKALWYLERQMKERSPTPPREYADWYRFDEKLERCHFEPWQGSAIRCIWAEVTGDSSFLCEAKDYIRRMIEVERVK